VKMAFDSVMATLPLIRAGKLRTFGVASSQRANIAPDIPTLVEEGGPKFELNSWYGLMAPAGTPPQIVARLNAEALKALADPQLKAIYAGLGIEIIGNTPVQFATQIREDMARWAEVAKTANVHAE
jgi:tripartite-type tricarboxylate transporter receptor subunit TctC